MEDKDIEDFLKKQNNELPGSERIEAESEQTIVGNHTGYGYQGSENFEHDDTGCVQNYSGVEDDVFTSMGDHEDWKEGYDY